jgi:HAD superfamily hydrolase (TIGR01549 family)
MAFTGVILDVDGTLVQSNDAHAYAWVEAFAAYGYRTSFEQIRPLIGMGGDQIIPRLVPGLKAEEGTGKQISEHRKQLILNKFGPQLTATEGARELVHKLQEEGLHLIIASSATEAELDILLKVAQVDNLLLEYTTSSDVDESKPEPDIVQAALEKANLRADSTIMIGDTPYDIESAARSGVGVIAFRSGGFSDEQLSGALEIYDHPADLLERYRKSSLC